MDTVDRDALIRATFDNAPDGIVVLDPQGTAVARNERFLALWRFPADMLERNDSREMREHTAGQLRDPQRYLDSLHLLLATREALVLDEHQLLDGRVLERHVAPLAAQGRPGYLVVRWRDVSERAHAQARERELSALLDLAMADAQLAYWDADLISGRVSSINGKWYDMLGYGVGELGDRLSAWHELVHPDDAAARTAAWDAHVSGHTEQYEAQFRMRHKSGRWVWIHARGHAVMRDSRGMATRMVGTRADISEQKESEIRLTEQAQVDPLTGVANRRHFLHRGQAMLEAARQNREPVALLMMDLDHFKSINDLEGHAAGDEVLCHFASTVRELMRERDLLGRIGGEEFAVMLFDVSAGSATAIANRLVRHVRGRPAQLEGRSIAVTVSVGVAASKPQGAAESLEQLFARADVALYQAKAMGRDQAVLADERLKG